MDSPTLLAFDTSTIACSAAVCRGGAVLARRFELMPRGQSEALVPMIQVVMAEAGLTYGDLDRLAVTVGPGAFTGIRIGLATARAMALAARLPLVPVTTTEAVARGVGAADRAGRRVVVALDSKRNDLFVQAFDDTLAALTEPVAVAKEKLAGWLGPGAPGCVVGDAADAALAHLPADARAADANPAPDAVRVADLAADRSPVLRPAPLYLRPPEAKLPKQGGRLRP